MLKMRLQRIGRRNDPSYRVIVVDSRQGPKSGKYVDLIGSYNPKMDRVQVDGEKAKAWIAKGVQVSPTVHNILINEQVIEGKKVNVLPKKSPIVSEQPEEEKSDDTPDEAVATEDASDDTKKDQEEESTKDTPQEEIAPEAAAEETKKEEVSPSA